MHKLLSRHPVVFTKTFLVFVDKLLTCWKREPAVERLVSFTVGFFKASAAKGETTTFTKAEQDFADNLLKHLLLRGDASGKAPRFRSCMIIAGLMENFPEEYDIDEELWDSLQSGMTSRTMDKITAVRVHAVHALKRLADPEDPECPTTTVFIDLLSHDSSSAVRKAVLADIGISRITLPHILARTRDVKFDVRAQAIHMIASKISVALLSIDQRLNLLYQGLYDASATVKSETLELLSGAWLDQAGGSIIKLLELLDIEECEQMAELILYRIFVQASAAAPSLTNTSSQKNEKAKKTIAMQTKLRKAIASVPTLQYQSDLIARAKARALRRKNRVRLRALQMKTSANLDSYAMYVFKIECKIFFYTKICT
eukprot:GSMAST32.ASY1.ANO1.678.1 assembled CDS